jgi:thiamine-phosphate pyrophosphorylase
LKVNAHLQYDESSRKFQMNLPPLYPILDFSSFAAKPNPLRAMVSFAEQLLAAGATILQYRDKSSDPRTFLANARELRRVTLNKATFVINDCTDLALACDADGVHLGQDDLSPAAARRIFDAARQGNDQRVPHPAKQWVPRPFAATANELKMLSSERVGIDAAVTHNNLLIGFSTHNLAQVREAGSLPVDYIAVGPVFATGSKANPDPVVGLDGVRAARAATSKPLVAIGGITRANARQVLAAGADSVAVISDLLESPAKAVADFLRILR